MSPFLCSWKKIVVLQCRGELRSSAGGETPPLRILTMAWCIHIKKLYEKPGLRKWGNIAGKY